MKLEKMEVKRDGKTEVVHLPDADAMWRDLLVYGNHYYDYRTGERLDPEKVVLSSSSVPTVSVSNGRFIVSVSLKCVQIEEDTIETLKDSIGEGSE